MKPSTRLIIKQLIKYALIIVVVVTGIFAYKILTDLPKDTMWLGLGIGGGILLISLIFDILSAKDIFPILKR